MPVSKPMIVLSLLIITLGVGWLLNALELVAGIDMIWPGILAVLGLLTLGLAGIDKVTFVVGPMLIAGAILLVLHQAGKANPSYTIPGMVILFGTLLFITTVSPVPMPKWMTEDGDNPLPPGK